MTNVMYFILSGKKAQPIPCVSGDICCRHGVMELTVSFLFYSKKRLGKKTHDE